MRSLDQLSDDEKRVITFVRMNADIMFQDYNVTPQQFVRAWCQHTAPSSSVEHWLRIISKYVPRA